MTEPTITHDDVIQLERSFEHHEYEVREGPTNYNKDKIRWFVYITREAVYRRLTEVFGGEWGTKLEGVYPHGNNVTVCRSITIRGIYRDFTGSASGDDENLVKSADTDAFKRVCSMWGIGMELQSMPQIWTAYDYKDGNRTDWDKRRVREQEAMDKAMKAIFGAAPGNPTTPTSNGKAKPWATRENLGTLINRFNDETNAHITITEFEILCGMNADDTDDMWNSTYKTGQDALNYALRRNAEGVLTRIQESIDIAAEGRKVAQDLRMDNAYDKANNPK